MAQTQFRKLTLPELETVYREHMTRDFPHSELKPFSRLKALVDGGTYEAYGLFEDGAMIAYDLYWLDRADPYVMLDYFAVVPDRRNGGTGSGLLRDMLERFCAGGGGVFGEVEIPDTGDPAVDDLRRRRLGFYARAGMRTMGFRTRVFGVPYVVVAYGPEISDEALMATDRKLYRQAFPPAVYEKEVFIPWESK